MAPVLWKKKRHKTITEHITAHKSCCASARACSSQVALPEQRHYEQPDLLLLLLLLVFLLWHINQGIKNMHVIYPDENPDMDFSFANA